MQARAYGRERLRWRGWRRAVGFPFGAAVSGGQLPRAKISGAANPFPQRLERCSHFARAENRRASNVFIWRLLSPGLANDGRLGQREEHDLLAGDGADVVVQRDDLDVCD